MTVSPQLREQMLDLIPSLRAFAVSLCGDRERGDDLVQEALVKAWANIHTFQENTNLRAWLFTILRNEFYSEMRKKGREVEDVDGAYAGQLSTPAPQIGQVELGELRQALTVIPDDQRDALLLVSVLGFSYEDTANICGCATGTIKSRVNRARARLLHLMQIDGEAEFGPDQVDEAVVNVARLAS